MLLETKKADTLVRSVLDFFDGKALGFYLHYFVCELLARI